MPAKSPALFHGVFFGSLVLQSTNIVSVCNWFGMGVPLFPPSLVGEFAYSPSPVIRRLKSIINGFTCSSSPFIVVVLFRILSYHTVQFSPIWWCHWIIVQKNVEMMSRVVPHFIKSHLLEKWTYILVQERHHVQVNNWTAVSLIWILFVSSGSRNDTWR